MSESPHEAEGEWSAYAVTLNQRLDRVLALARRRGIDEASIAAALSTPAGPSPETRIGRYMIFRNDHPEPSDRPDPDGCSWEVWEVIDTGVDAVDSDWFTFPDAVAHVAELLGAALSAARPSSPTPEEVPEMALRPDDRFPDELDDIVVKDVEMFRAEANDDKNWWMRCYFRNGESVSFGLRIAKDPRRLVIEATDLPAAWTDIDSDSGDDATTKEGR